MIHSRTNIFNSKVKFSEMKIEKLCDALPKSDEREDGKQEIVFIRPNYFFVCSLKIASITISATVNIRVVCMTLYAENMIQTVIK